MIKVTFPDGSVHEFEKGVKILDVAISISEGFARNVIGAVVNDDIIKGLSETLKEDCTVKFVKFEDKEEKKFFGIHQVTLWLLLFKDYFLIQNLE